MPRPDDGAGIIFDLRLGGDKIMSETIPTHVANTMCEQARWLGLWAGSADGLAVILQRYADNDDVKHALTAYKELRQHFYSRQVLGFAAPLTGEEAS